jgi:cytidylate kinase
LPNHLTIAIDGPVASGKTVVGQAVARQLGIRFLDTGTMYRAFTWAALGRGIDHKDTLALTKLARDLDVRLVLEGDRQALLVDGKDATPHLREPEVERAVSHVSAVRAVRTAMVSLQRKVARDGPIVMVGRDIGTVVLKDAALKVFLKASPDVRAKRRYNELQESFNQLTYEEVLASLVQRDKIDTERADSPLRPAEDAIQVDTDPLTVGQVVEKILELAKQR